MPNCHIPYAINKYLYTRGRKVEKKILTNNSDDLHQIKVFGIEIEICTNNITIRFFVSKMKSELTKELYAKRKHQLLLISKQSYWLILFDESENSVFPSH